MLLKRLFQFAALLALLLAPAGMLGNHAAMAMPQHGASMAVSHCDEQRQKPQDSPTSSTIDCMIACSALPAVDPFVPPNVLPSAITFQAATPLEIEGKRSEAATPPPRTI